MRSLWHRLVQIDLWLEQYRLPIFLLALVVVLRIPTFFEPYWYGDEGIYLVLGEALNRGRILYAEIIDHKTPLIYVFAQVGSQFNFRILMLVWLVAATAALMHVGKRLFKHTLSWVISVMFFIAVISLPSFEGTIPNGELFVIGFVLVAVALILRTEYWNVKKSNYSHDAPLFGLAGVFFGLGMLTKVPAILDLGAWMAILVIHQLDSLKTMATDLRKRFLPISMSVTLVVIGAVTTIVLSILYFVLRGEGQAYLDYGLLYNFRYAGTWQPSFPHPVFSLLFSLPGKALIMTVGIATAWLYSKRLPRYWTISLVWFWCALFASLLSNRPYPHYFLQVLPPLSLLLGSIAETIRVKRTLSETVGFIALTTPVFVAIVGVVLLLHVGLYPTASYYQNWATYITGKKSLSEYMLWFNPLMRDNYDAAKIIREQGNGHLFIWGTNPMLYALSDTIPSGRFTVAFHIHDFKAYEETLRDLKSDSPPFIVTMYDETGELPGLRKILLGEYRMYRSFEHYDLWKRNATQ